MDGSNKRGVDMRIDEIRPGFYVCPHYLYGKVLQGGLGIGFMTRKILEFTKVTKLVVVEQDQDVIDMFRNNDLRLTIIKGNFKPYAKQHHAMFDFICSDISWKYDGWAKRKSVV